MQDTSTHLLLSHARRRELSRQAEQDSRARRLLRLRQLDRRSQAAASRATLLRVTLT